MEEVRQPGNQGLRILRSVLQMEKVIWPILLIDAAGHLTKTSDKTRVIKPGQNILKKVLAFSGLMHYNFNS